MDKKTVYELLDRMLDDLGKLAYEANKSYVTDSVARAIADAAIDLRTARENLYDELYGDKPCR